MDELKYLLDTNICIHFLKNDIKVVEKIKEVGLENCYLSEMTILEFSYGVANGDPIKKAENKKKFKKFEESFDDRILLVRTAFEDFSNQKVRLRKLGTPISDFDLLIGCTALAHDFTLASRNIKEMNRIERLKLENWIDS
jgi:tRNA(fMet)-specific endonuclease VapC